MCTGLQLVINETNNSERNIRLFFEVDFLKVILNVGGSFYTFPYLVLCKADFQVSPQSQTEYLGPYPAGDGKAAPCVKAWERGHTVVVVTFLHVRRGGQ